MTDADNERIIFDEVQIGSGFCGMRPLAQHGFIIVESDALTLRGDNHQLIDSGPISEVKANRTLFTMNRTFMLTVNGTRYSATPKMGVYVPAVPLPGMGGLIKKDGDRLMRLIEAAAKPSDPEPGKGR